jgi:hypothetical protein
MPSLAACPPCYVLLANPGWPPRLPPAAELAGLADQQLLQKYLKVTPEELSVGSMGQAMLNRIAGRDC